jgi:hypothetical protein
VTAGSQPTKRKSMALSIMSFDLRDKCPEAEELSDEQQL